MNQNRIISAAVLFLLLGATLPAFAQKGEEEKGRGEGKAQQAQPQQQPQRAQQAQPQRAQQMQQQRQPRAVAYNGGNHGNRYGRISNASYSAHFGQGHSFHMMRPQMIGGYNRFQYGGYWFGFNEGWPVGWDYNDDVYVVFVDGAYYMYDLRHPGIHITLNLF